MRSRYVRLSAFFLIIVAGSIGGAWLLTRPPSPLAAADHLIEAVAFRFLGPPRQANPDVVVVGITEETLSAFPYRSPIDRGFLAGLIDALAADGVRAIGLDVVLDRPTEPAKDATLHRALTRSDIPVVAISVAPDTKLPPGQRRFLSDFLSGVRTGDANLVRDRFDDVVRDHVPSHAKTGALSFPAAIAMALGVPVPHQIFPIAWQRSPTTGADMQVYPAEAVALLPRAWLNGKVVLIGSLIQGSDEHRTLPSTFGQPSFGVQIHAQVVSQLLNGRAYPVPEVPWSVLLSLTGLAMTGAALGMALAGLWAPLTTVAVGAGFAAAALTAYSSLGYLIPIVSPLLALTLAGASASGWRGLGDRRDRRALRALFSRFVSEPVVNEIMKERDLFMAGGRPRPQELTATVLYADVAGFTTICEQLSPEPLIAWLDRYIDAMAANIMDHDGVLLRFIGDGILAVFGVPVPRRDEAAIAADANNAARCALAMEQAMVRLNDAWGAEGMPVGGLRIGLHTGTMVAGSLGTGARMEFCLLGDTANTGARLEQLGKDYAEPIPGYCTIVVGEPTWQRLAGAFPGIKIGDFVLRGRHSVMAAYRIDSAASARAAKCPPPTDPPEPFDPIL